MTWHKATGKTPKRISSSVKTRHQSIQKNHFLKKKWHQKVQPLEPLQPDPNLQPFSFIPFQPLHQPSHFCLFNKLLDQPPPKISTFQAFQQLQQQIAQGLHLIEELIFVAVVLGEQLLSFFRLLSSRGAADRLLFGTWNRRRRLNGGGELLDGGKDEGE